ncbi:outer membrane protein [Novosphingobium mangrovi (ex Huang et al. 2023)]|uniref:Porin family protein n=1 Tax=Novosphingobium mangrovi (ex Huang et al. 2023) TaxID=2976432 RepID=A0ABT2I4I9_9SPHN|nr:porin family protein [Novosphingobium mangrovi (ex Huang et al. 2023)]MCT2399700.1 porin family protein [Novosphingobium mangrovi (ex Huang et al. 2023)]
MKKFAIAGAAAALFAIPAAANAQAYVQVETGLDSISVQGESDEGLNYGVSAGYDLPLSGGMFVGIQGTVADSTTKECARDVLAAGDRLCVKTGRDLAAVVRLGTSVGDKSKLYVFGGYTNARIRATYSDGVDSASDGANGDGFRLGAGYQYDLSDKIFVKAEYRYSNYESDFSRHNGIVALGVKF